MVAKSSAPEPPPTKSTTTNHRTPLQVWELALQAMISGLAGLIIAGKAGAHTRSVIGCLLPVPPDRRVDKRQRIHQSEHRTVDALRLSTLRN